MICAMRIAAVIYTSRMLPPPPSRLHATPVTLCYMMLDTRRLPPITDLAQQLPVTNEYAQANGRHITVTRFSRRVYGECSSARGCARDAASHAGDVSLSMPYAFATSECADASCRREAERGFATQIYARAQSFHFSPPRLRRFKAAYALCAMRRGQ